MEVVRTGLTNQSSVSEGFELTCRVINRPHYERNQTPADVRRAKSCGGKRGCVNTHRGTLKIRLKYLRDLATLSGMSGKARETSCTLQAKISADNDTKKSNR